MPNPLLGRHQASIRFVFFTPCQRSLWLT